MVLIRVACFVGLILLGSTAEAQFGGSGSSFGAGELLGAAMLVAFSGLTIWGFFSGFDALLPPPSLPPQRRLALRWIGVNRLEPSVTSLLIAIVVVMQMRFEIAYAPSPIFWLALPTITFLGALLPPVWFRSKLDAAVQHTWRGLRWIAVARVAPYLLLGLGSLFWSWRLMARLAAQLNTRQPLLQPLTSSYRMQTDAE